MAAMVIGCCRIEVHVPESTSLKAKRMVLKSVKDRIHARFNVSIAEIDHQDLWQRAVLGVAAVSTQREHAHQVLSRVVRAVESEHRLSLIGYEIEML